MRSFPWLEWVLLGCTLAAIIYGLLLWLDSVEWPEAGAAEGRAAQALRNSRVGNLAVPEQHASGAGVGRIVADPANADAVDIAGCQAGQVGGDDRD
jgi:hypothetical protein